MNKPAALLLCAALVCLAALPTPAQAQGEETQRPNVILMMADDLASDDLSCYGGQLIDTPNLDGLAEQGMSLTSYYAGNPVCSPSRMALLSGSYPARLGWQWGVLGYGFAPRTGMSTDVYTIAEAFGDAGYRTAISGKWHLGVQDMRPEDQGFDSTYYIRMSNNQNRDMFRNGQLVEEAFNNRLLTETFTEEVIRVINEESDEPFFLYVPWSAPHFPAEAHPDWRGNSDIGEYGDVVEELDHCVGLILAALEASGQADNTIIIFTSDNGRQSGQNQGSESIYRGQKWYSTEGGTRVPLIIRYPGVVPEDSTSDAIISAIDLFPTLAHACGVEINLPEEAQQMDGVNVWDVFAGGQGVESARTELLYWHGRGQATAIRIGDWKLFFNHGVLNERHSDPDASEGPLLFNLAEDIGETTNVAAQHPERVEAMMARARELLLEVYENQVPIGYWGEGEPDVEPLRAEDVWGPWIE